MKKKNFRPIVWAFLVLLPIALAGHAYSQGNTWSGSNLSNMMEAARWRVGAFRINAALALSNVGYDSDIYYGYFGEPVPDGTASASLPIQVFLPIGKQVVLDISDTPEYLFYLNTERERAWNNVFQGRVHFSLEWLYLQAGGAMSDVRQRLSPELNFNVREKRDSLNGTVLLQASKRISLAVLFEGSRYNYGESEPGTTYIDEWLSRDEGYFDFVTYIQPNSRIRFFLDGQYGIIDFHEALASVRNTRSYAGFIGLAFIPREGRGEEDRAIEPPQGRACLGYKQFDILDSLLSDGNGLVGSVALSSGLFKRTIGRVSFFRDFEFSVYPGSTYYYSTRFGGGLSRRLSRHALFSYDLELSRGLYPDMAGVEPAASRDFNYTTHRVSLNIQMARHLEMTFWGEFGQRSLVGETTASHRNFVGFNLVYGSLPQAILLPERGLGR